MDPNTLVLEISSDEEVNWEDHVGRGITDGGDDHVWLTELLEEVGRADSGEDDGGGGDSDEVVVVSEVLPAKKPKKKSKSKSLSLVDLDDECVILDNDPDKAVEIWNDDPSNGNEDDDSDDLRVVCEKGQVACRDYPHPRHLCIKFPFSSTPNRSTCNQCYCYVCDSLAPCLYWGDGSSSVDHCHATDKDEFWKLERKNSKNGDKPISKVANTPLSDQLPPPGMVRPASTLVPPTSVAHNQFWRPILPPNFGVPNRSPVFVPRNKYQQPLLSRARDRVTHLHRAVFKRTGSGGHVPIANRYSYSSYGGNFGIPTPHSRNPSNGMLSGPNRCFGQSNLVSTSMSFAPQNLTSSTVNPLLQEPLPFQSQFSCQSNPNTSFDFSQHCQSQGNLDPYVENPNHFQPHLISSSHQPQVPLPQPSYIPSAQPNYPVPAQARVDSPSISVSDYTQNLTHQESQSQSATIAPSFTDYGIFWPSSETNQQPATESSQLEAVAPTNESSLTGLVDYQYDNWMFDNQVVEPGSMDIPGPFGFNEFSPDTAFIDTGTIFDF